MAFTTLWKRLSPTQLNVAIQAFSLIAIFFEGYDQGVMGGVNAAPRYVEEVGIGLPDGTVTNTTTQGGIVSIVSGFLSLSNGIPPDMPYIVLSWMYRRLLRRRLGRRSHWPYQWHLHCRHFRSHRRGSPSLHSKSRLHPRRTCRYWAWHRSLNRNNTRSDRRSLRIRPSRWLSWICLHC